MRKKILLLISLFFIVNLSACGKSKRYDLSSINKCKVVTKYNRKSTVENMDVVTFGSYPQEDGRGNEKEPIDWIVLEKQGDNVLLLSKYILDCKCYNDVLKEVTWETCSLRSWLNNDFYKKAFNSDEQRYIISTKVKNNDNFEYNSKGGNDTNDKVFCLSIEEVEKYFKQANMQSENRRLATKGTRYASSVDNGGKRLFVTDPDANRDFWWGGNSNFLLRSPGINNEGVAYVYYDGHLRLNGTYVKGLGYGVRPAILVNVSSVEKLDVKKNK